MTRSIVAAAIAVGILLASAPASAQTPPPNAPSPAPLMLEGWTDDDTKVAGTLLSYACKASPGEDLTACDAAIRLRRKLAAGKRTPAPEAAEPPKPVAPRVE